MADQEHEHEHEQEHEHEHDIVLQETPVEKVEVDPSTLTPTSPEVISR